MPRYTQRDIPALIKARKAFECGNISATSHYPNGISFTPARGWNHVMWPTTGALYIVYSYATPIGWIDQWGRVKRTPEHFSVTSSKHQSRIWSLADDDVITGTEADWRVQDNIDQMRYTDWLNDREEDRREKQRQAQQRRYWTPERLAAKEAREQAKEIAATYGIKPREALEALTQAPKELSVEDVIASLTGTPRTRDATEQSGSLTHA